MSVSTKPYLVRAIHEWCTDNDFTPYVELWVDERVSVPHEYIKENRIVLNISYDATKNLCIDNNWIAFSARFGGVAHEIWAPVGHILAIFAQETGQGMGFDFEATEVPSEGELGSTAADNMSAKKPASDPKGEKRIAKSKSRAHLKIVK